MRSSQCAGADSSDVFCAGADSSDVLCAGAWSGDVFCPGPDASEVSASAAPATAQASVRATNRSLLSIAFGLVRWLLGGGARFAAHEGRQQITARDGRGKHA